MKQTLEAAQRRKTLAAVWKKYGHWVYALILPLYLVGFFVEEHFIDGSFPYLVSYLPLDDAIPFCEWWYLFYVLWYPFMGAIGFYLGIYDPKGFKQYMTYIGVSFFTALVLFALFPNGQDLRPDLTQLGRENVFTRLIGVLYQTDTNTNVCPSLHVVGSIAVIFPAFHNERLRRTRWVPIGAIFIACLICASTVFIKQHSILDVFVGIPYALLLYPLIYHPLRRPRHRRAVADEN